MNIGWFLNLLHMYKLFLKLTYLSCTVPYWVIKNDVKSRQHQKARHDYCVVVTL